MFFKKPWFTRECRNARQCYRKAKRLFKKFGGSVFKEDFYLKERLYKKNLRSAVENHRVKMKQKLSVLRTRNPKECWRIIDSGLKIFMMKSYIRSF